MSNVVNLFGAAKSAAPPARKRSDKKPIALVVKFGGDQTRIAFTKDVATWARYVDARLASTKKQLAAAKRYEGVPPGVILQ